MCSRVLPKPAKLIIFSEVLSVNKQMVFSLCLYDLNSIDPQEWQKINRCSYESVLIIYCMLCYKSKISFLNINKNVNVFSPKASPYTHLYVGIARISSLWEMKTEEKLLNSIFFSIYHYHIPTKTNIVNQLRTNTKSRMWITIYLLFVCFLLYWNLNVSLHKPK